MMKRAANLMMLVLCELSLTCVAAQKQLGTVVLSNVLQGSQEKDELVLSDQKNAYVVMGEYVVPQGMSLKIENGVTLLFSKGAGLSIEGELLVNGTTNSPVVFRGQSTGLGVWQGIRIGKSDSTDITCAVISGAISPVNFSAPCKAAVRKSLIYRNLQGIQAHGGPPLVEDCAIVENRGDGIYNYGGEVSVENCYIGRNSGWGLQGEYGPGLSMNGTVVTRNQKGGIYYHLYDRSVVIHQSAFVENKGIEAQIGMRKSWDCTENYWGKTMTALLKAKGSNVRLPKIKDKRHGDSNVGMIDVSNFLEDMPQNCGPRECVHLKGIY